MKAENIFRGALCSVLLLGCSCLSGQQGAGTWTAHFAYKPSRYVTQTSETVWCAQTSGLFVYHKAKGTLTPKTKVDGLSSTGITALAADETTGQVVAGYADGTVDLLSVNRLRTVDDISRQMQYAARTINHVNCCQGKAYLSCGFGLAVLDISKRRLTVLYLPGDGETEAEVWSTACFQNRIYAATSKGLRVAALTDPLSDVSCWQTLALPQSLQPAQLRLASNNQILLALNAQGSCMCFDGTTWTATELQDTSEASDLQAAADGFYVTRRDGVHVLDAEGGLRESIESYGNLDFAPRAAAGQPDGTVWIADYANGLIEKKGQTVTAHAPNGPSQTFSGEMRFAGGILYAAGGGMDSDGEGLQQSGGIHLLSGHTWTSVMNPQVHDFTTLDIYPGQPGRLAVGAWGTGVLGYDNQTVQDVWTADNSPLTPYSGGGAEPGSVRYDAQGNLWVSQAHSRQPVLVLTSGGEWLSFAWPYSGRGARIFFDSSSRGWLYAPDSGVLLFSDGGTVSDESDDRTMAFSPVSAYGNAIYTVNCFAEDRNGTIWAGTESGVVLFSNPDRMFDGQGLTGTYVLVPGLQEPDKVYPLLGAESVLSLAVDGANRKWIGTATSGVFLVSADNREVVQHFTAENSPLPCNRVTDICLSDVSTEVFFNTPSGMVSYASDAVASHTDFDNMYVYPNPVRPSYDGQITVTGLVDGTDVRITDVSGRLVFRTTSIGGQVVWDGRLKDGRRPATGVYLVFCATADGTRSAVTKLLFVK